MLFKRTAFALALAAALLAVAPAAPASPAAPVAPTAPATHAEWVSPGVSGGPAWGYFYASKSFQYYRYDAADTALFGGVAATVCTVAPIFLASGPAGAVVWGLSCSYAAVG